MGVGENIRALRIMNGMTQEELAEKMGYKNKASINKIEKEVNSMPIEKIQKFADVLHTSVAILMGEPDDPKYVIGPHIRGLLKEQEPSKEEMSKTYIELIDIASGMNDDGLKRLLAYAEDIRDKYRKEK